MLSTKRLKTKLLLTSLVAAIGASSFISHNNKRVSSKHAFAEEENKEKLKSEILQIIIEDATPESVKRAREAALQFAPTDFPINERAALSVWLSLINCFFTNTSILSPSPSAPSSQDNQIKGYIARLMKQRRESKELQFAWDLVHFSNEEWQRLSEPAKRSVVNAKLRVAHITQDLDKMKEALGLLKQLPADVKLTADLATASVLSNHLAEWDNVQSYATQANNKEQDKMKKYHMMNNAVPGLPNYKSVDYMKAWMERFPDLKQKIQIPAETLDAQRDVKMEILSCEQSFKKGRNVPEDEATLQQWKPIVVHPSADDIHITGAVATWMYRVQDATGKTRQGKFSGIANLKEGGIMMHTLTPPESDDKQTCFSESILGLEVDKKVEARDEWKGALATMRKCFDKQQPDRIASSSVHEFNLRMKLKQKV